MTDQDEPSEDSAAWDETVPISELSRLKKCFSSFVKSCDKKEEDESPNDITDDSGKSWITEDANKAAIVEDMWRKSNSTIAIKRRST